MKRRAVTLVVLVAVVLGFAYGLHRLFALRFSAGDVYPPYSSLRADPLGSRAFLEALQLLPRLEVRRLFEPLRTLGSATDTTLLVLGADAVDFHESSEAEVAELAGILDRGGRIVVTLEPVNEEPFASRIRQTATAKGTPNKRPTSPRRRLLAEHEVSLRTRWGFDVAYEKLTLDDDHVAKPVTVVLTNGPAGFPTSLSWHTATVFTGLDEAWSTIYQRDSRPVVIERKLGRGSIVMCTDSYWISNEALRVDRQPALLLWLIGPARQVVFDEVHLGVTSQPGIATLARRYRLQGFFAGLIVLAGLYIWKSASSFVPSHADATTAIVADAVAGRDAGSGLVNLLRRGIPPRQLLEACFEEWRRHAAATSPSVERKLARLDEARTAAANDPVTGYRQITQILSER